MRSYGLEAKVDNLYLEGFEAFAKLPRDGWEFPLDVKRISSSTPLHVILDGRQHSCTSLRFGDHKPAISTFGTEKLVLGFRGEGPLVIQPLSTLAWDFYHAFFRGRERHYWQRAYFRFGSLESVEWEGEMGKRGSRIVRTYKNVSATNRGLPCKREDLAALHGYLLDNHAADVRKMALLRSGTVPLPYGEGLLCDSTLALIAGPDGGGAAILLENPPANGKRSEKRYSLMLDGKRKFFRHASIILNGTARLGAREEPLASFILRRMAPQAVREYTGGPLGLDAVLTAKFARFSGVAPRTWREDGMITPSYQGPLVEELAPAEFTGLRTLCDLPRNATIADVLDLPERPDVKLSFSYKGTLYQPEMELPSCFGQAL